MAWLLAALLPAPRPRARPPFRRGRKSLCRITRGVPSPQILFRFVSSLPRVDVQNLSRTDCPDGNIGQFEFFFNDGVKVPRFYGRLVSASKAISGGRSHPLTPTALRAAGKALNPQGRPFNDWSALRASILDGAKIERRRQSPRLCERK